MDRNPLANNRNDFRTVTYSCPHYIVTFLTPKCNLCNLGYNLGASPLNSLNLIGPTSRVFQRTENIVNGLTSLLMEEYTLENGGMTKVMPWAM